jgi:hypothetical protein
MTDHLTRFLELTVPYSNIYPRPSYQNAAVAKYLATYPPPYASYSCQYNDTSCYANNGVYNRAGRVCVAIHCKPESRS